MSESSKGVLRKPALPPCRLDRNSLPAYFTGQKHPSCGRRHCHTVPEVRLLRAGGVGRRPGAWRDLGTTASSGPLHRAAAKARTEGHEGSVCQAGQTRL